MRMGDAGDPLDIPVEAFPDTGEQSLLQRGIDALKEKAAVFVAAYRKLDEVKDVAGRDPATYQEWLTLKSRADSAREKIDYINSVVDKSVNWVKSVFGLDGMEALGFLPLLIPIAYVTAATAALIYVTADIYKFVQKLSLVKGGLLPASELDKGGILDQSTGLVKSLAILGGIALIGYFLYTRSKK